MAVTNNFSLPEKKYSIRYGFVSNIPFYLDDQFKAGWATYDDPNIEMSRKALTPSTTVNYTTSMEKEAGFCSLMNPTLKLNLVQSLGLSDICTDKCKIKIIGQ